MIVFDIETAGLPWHELSKVVPPFDEEKAVPHPGNFDANSVAIGNLKVPAKIDAKISEARGAHALAVKDIAKKRAAARNDYAAKWTEKAALSAITGTVKAIGIRNTDDDLAVLFAVDATPGEEHVPLADVAEVLYFPDEMALLIAFWLRYAAMRNAHWVGHNIHGFDLPFLTQRSWKHRVTTPDLLVNGGGRYYSNQFVDTMVKWNCGNREYTGLNAIAQHFGHPGKPDDCSGADFARLFDNRGEDRVKALRYLVGDLEMTQLVAEGMGLI